MTTTSNIKSNSYAILGTIGVCLFALCLGSCAVAEANINPSLTNNTQAMPVKGMNWQGFNQKLTFGEFSTEKVKRGWISSYSFPFFVNFSSAKQKMQFKLTDGTRHSEVFCLQRLYSEELPTFNNTFNLPLTYRNIYAGSIVCDNKTDKIWEFVVQNPNQNEPLKNGLSQKLEGFVRNGNERIEIEGITGYKNAKGALQNLTITGYELRQHGKVIAATENFGRGRAWIMPSLDADTKFVVANVVAAILLRSQIELQD